MLAVTEAQRRMRASIANTEMTRLKTVAGSVGACGAGVGSCGTGAMMRPMINPYAARGIGSPEERVGDDMSPDTWMVGRDGRGGRHHGGHRGGRGFGGWWPSFAYGWGMPWYGLGACYYDANYGGWVCPGSPWAWNPWGRGWFRGPW